MSTSEWQPTEFSQVVEAAYGAVQAILSDDHNYERGVEEARRVVEAVQGPSRAHWSSLAVVAATGATAGEVHGENRLRLG